MTRITPSPASPLVTLSDPRSPAAEAYRGLRTSLAFARPDAPIRTLVVTSPAPDAEKSVVLANLAIVTAQAGRRVIVADCDLRRPAQHRLFGLGNASGVATSLVGEPTGDAPLQPTSVDGLSVLTSGPPPAHPAELLGSRRMAALLGRLADQADLVLVDAPPVVAVTDAAVLAPLVDGVLLVLAAGRSRRDHAARARELLDKVGATVVGVALTGVALEAPTYGAEGRD